MVRTLRRQARHRHPTKAQPPLLFQLNSSETAKWASWALFDVYDFPAASIMPPDAYGSICQCKLCEGKDMEEMGARGKLSNHVFDFANRLPEKSGRPIRTK